MDTNGFYGDTFSSGFGDFYTAKKRDLSDVYGRDSPFSDPENVYNDQPELTDWENSKFKVTRTFISLKRIQLYSSK